MNDEQRELISAYHDGQLDAAGARDARMLLQRDAAARSFLDEIADLDRRLSDTFDPVMCEPLPHAFERLGTKRRRGHLVQMMVPTALAAGLLLAAVMIFRQEAVEQNMRDQLLLIQHEVALLRHKTLENVPSGESASWTAKAGFTRAEVVPLKTYRTVDNRFCREYEERIEDAAGVEIRRGIACREGKGNWPDLASDSSSPDKGQSRAPGTGIKM